MTKNHHIFRDDLLKKKASGQKPASSRFGWLGSPLIKVVLGVFWCGTLLRLFKGDLQHLPKGWELILGFACFAAALAILWQTIRRFHDLQHIDEQKARAATYRLRQGHVPDAQVAFYDDEVISQSAAQADYQHSRS
jgi:hypothetical protein